MQHFPITKIFAHIEANSKKKIYNESIFAIIKCGRIAQIAEHICKVDKLIAVCDIDSKKSGTSQ